MKAGDEKVQGAAEEAEPLTWQIHFGALSPKRRAVCGIACVFAGVMGYLLTSNALVGILGVAAIFASTAEMFLPASYELNHRGASVRLGLSRTEIEWESVKRLLPQPGGIRLSPLEKSSRLDEFRGVLLRFSGNEEAVLAKIRELCEKHELQLAGTLDGGGGERTD